MDKTGTGIYCSCCDGNHHQEKLAEIHPREALEIKDRRHGQNHIAVISPREVLERLSGTTGEGILNYVRGIIKW